MLSYVSRIGSQGFSPLLSAYRAASVRAAPAARADRKPPIVAFANHPWDEPQWMNRQQLLSRLAARGWPVIYSSGPMDVWERRSKRWRQAPLLGSLAGMDGVWVDRPGRCVPRWRRMPAWDRTAVRVHAERLRAAAVEMAGTEPIALSFHPMFWPSVSALRTPRIAFHIYDAYPLTTEWSPAMAANLNRLADSAKLITLATEPMGTFLADKERPKTRFLPNGADVDAFMAAAGGPCPADLAAIPHPRICYAGALNRKVDYGAIAGIARQRPDWHVVLIGTIQDDYVLQDPELADDYAACRSLPNVHFLGLKSRTEVPAYLHHMDVNAMIYRAGGSGWYRLGYPLKLHEYLAVGKPVISARLEAVVPFGAVVDFADAGPESWAAAVERALAGGVGSPEARRAVALENTWDKRVDSFEGWLSELAA